MSKLLDKLKKGAILVKAATIASKIVFIERGTKSIVCKNHLAPDGKSPLRVIVSLNSRMHEYNCSCGTIYKYL